MRIRLLPPLPSTSSARPSASRTTVGAIIDATRTPGGAAWKPSGWRSSSPSMLLSRMPVPGIDVARALAVRRRHRGDVAVGVGHADVGGPPRGGRRGLRTGELDRPPPVHLDHVLDERLRPGRAAPRLVGRAAQLQGEPDQPPAERRRRVREDATTAVVDRAAAPVRRRGRPPGRRRSPTRRRPSPTTRRSCRSPDRKSPAVPSASAVRRPARSGLRTGSPVRSSRPPGANTAAVAGSRVRIGSRMPRIAAWRGGERHPVGGEAGGGRDDGVAREPSESVVDVQVAGERAGYRHRAEPAVEGLDGRGEAHLDRLEPRARPVRGQASARRVDEEVEHHLLAGRGAGQQEPATGQAGEARLGDRGREPGGHRGVERVAPGLEHTGGGLDDRGMARRDAAGHSVR